MEPSRWTGSFPPRTADCLPTACLPAVRKRATCTSSRLTAAKAVGQPIPRVRWTNPQWLKDGSGFYYTRPREPEGIGPGEEVYHRRVFYHPLGAKWSEDKLIYGEELKKEEMPDAILSPDERYLLLDVFMGWGKNRLYVKDLRRDRIITIADDGESSYTGEIVGETAVRPHERGCSSIPSLPGGPRKTGSQALEGNHCPERCRDRLHESGRRQVICRLSP